MLYHVSFDLSKVTQVFTPRIPNQEKRMEGENDYIPRICVAKSLKDCLTAMPGGGYWFENSDKPKQIRVYEFDEETIKPENLVNSAYLYFSEWVLDAWITGEHWVIEQDLVPSKVYDVEIKEIEVVDAPYVSPNDFKEAYLKKQHPEAILDELEANAEKTVARVTELKYRFLKAHTFL